MKYKVKDEFTDQWTSEDIYPLIVTDEEIKALADGWGMAVEDLMEQVEEEGE